MPADLLKLEAAIRANAPKTKLSRGEFSAFGSCNGCCGLTAAIGEGAHGLKVLDEAESLFSLSRAEAWCFATGWDSLHPMRDGEPVYDLSIFSLGRRLARELIDGVVDGVKEEEDQK